MDAREYPRLRQGQGQHPPGEIFREKKRRKEKSVGSHVRMYTHFYFIFRKHEGRVRYIAEPGPSASVFFFEEAGRYGGSVQLFVGHYDMQQRLNLTNLNMYARDRPDLFVDTRACPARCRLPHAVRLFPPLKKVAR